MKIMHLSDLHLGKRVNEFSMLEDQKYILTRIINIIDEEKPEAVLIAGDVYDKAAHSGEAVELFDDFLVRLAKRELQVFIISGNHDSPERLAFANRLIDVTGIHLSPVYDGTVTPFSLEDPYGEVKIYMLPFVKPLHIRRAFSEETVESYTEALDLAVKKMDIDPKCRNILVTHQFVTGASTCESEERSVGGSDNVDGSVFEIFDYVALGHIHGPQNVGSEKIRYCGTPLKYSFSEAKHRKTVTILEMKEKGDQAIKEIPLVPFRDMVELKGTYEELMEKSFYENTSYQEDYVHITLTDEEEIMDAMTRLRSVYHNLMKMDYDNRRTRSFTESVGTNSVEEKSPMELFRELYVQQNGSEMSDEQLAFLGKLIETVWEGNA